MELSDIEVSVDEIALIIVYVRRVNFTAKSRFQNILKVAKFYINEFSRQYS